MLIMRTSMRDGMGNWDSGGLKNKFKTKEKSRTLKGEDRFGECTREGTEEYGVRCRPKTRGGAQTLER